MKKLSQSFYGQDGKVYLDYSDEFPKSIREEIERIDNGGGQILVILILASFFVAGFMVGLYL